MQMRIISKSHTVLRFFLRLHLDKVIVITMPFIVIILKPSNSNLPKEHCIKYLGIAASGNRVSILGEQLQSLYHKLILTSQKVKD